MSLDYETLDLLRRNHPDPNTHRLLQRFCSALF